MTNDPHDRTLPRIHGPLDATVCVPASKSIANRALLLAALAEGRSELREIPDGDDTLRMIDGLAALGVPIRVDTARRTATVSGVGGAWRAEDAQIDAGSAGSVLRFLTAAACVGQSDVRLDGSAQLRTRPMEPLVKALLSLGANITFEQKSGRCPLQVHARGLEGGRVIFHSPESSQFVSAVLMVAPLAQRDIFIDVRGTFGSRPYVAMTQSLMEHFGAAVVDDAGRFIVPAAQHYTAATLTIEPDASAASYFFALSALAGGRITVAGTRRASLQGDMRIVDWLEEMGCRIDERDAGLTVYGPPNGKLIGIMANLEDCPDLAPTLAVLAAFADGSSRLTGLTNLIHKESNRLTTIAHNLRLIGSDVEISDGEVHIRPGPPPASALIEAFDDHRIAMAFSLASTRMDAVTIRNADCVRKSFPAFFESLRHAAEK